jgi:hypothetical protein
VAGAFLPPTIRDEWVSCSNYMNDALNRKRSIEMYNIIQGYYNPEKDLHLALKIWNPKAPLSYHKKVQAEYEKLKNKL